MTRVLSVAPHPDDELLGCGGTLLRHVAAGDEVHWLIVTAMIEGEMFTADQIAVRNAEIDAITTESGFAGCHRLDFPTAMLDTIPVGDIVVALGTVVADIEPDVVYLPSRIDVHSDHRVVHEAVLACTKWFRYPSVVELYAYEALSETDVAPGASFAPQRFVDITPYLDRKVELLSRYEGEMGTFPFPRSEEAVRALAAVRGAAAGFSAAEAFEVLRQRVPAT